jgi:hypothetical protein
MQALAVTPPNPSRKVTPPRTGPALHCIQSDAAYTQATAEKPANSATSRLSHDRRHILSARYA